MKPPYYQIAEHYEACLKQHGPTHRGLDWPNADDLAVRSGVMLGVCRQIDKTPISILDLGCGIGLLVDYLKERGLEKTFAYRGVDLSKEMAAVASSRHPGRMFETRDVLKEPLPPGSADYVIMNGLLTVKATLSYEAMELFAHAIIKAAFDTCRQGIVFNVMSAHVDWKRDDLFHWPYDKAVAFLSERCSRHLVIRADYGLYEYTVYVYREPNR